MSNPRINVEAKKFHIELLNGFRLLDMDGTEISIPVTKGAAAIAYLLLSENNSLTREKLAALLWSNSSEHSAKTALRQCLHKLGAVLAKYQLDFFKVLSDRVLLDRTKVSCDVETIISGESLEVGRISLLTGDELLYGFEDLDPEFMDWLWKVRHSVGQKIRKILIEKLQISSSESSLLKYSYILNELDPSLEIAARPIIDKHIRDGNLIGMLQVYKSLWNSLDEVYEEEPSQNLQKLVGEARVQLGQILPGGLSSQQAVLSPIKPQNFVSILCVSPFSNNLQLDQKELLMTRIDRWLEAKATRIHKNKKGFCAVFDFPSSGSNLRLAIDTAIDLQKRFQTKDAHIVICVETALVEESGSSTFQDKFDRSFALLKNIKLGGIYSTSATFQELRKNYHFRMRHKMAGGGVVAEILGHKSKEKLEKLGEDDTFVGRNQFLNLLESAWARASAGSLQVLSIQGPAGVGKTRLVDHFFDKLELEGVVTATTKCSPYGKGSPAAPLRDLLKEDVASTRIEANLLVELKKSLFDQLCSEATAVFLDDWQWADQATRGVVYSLIDKLQKSKTMLIVASRELPLDDGLVRISDQVLLPPLNLKEVAAKAEHILSQPVDENLRSELYQKSGGSPLYLEEICHALRAEIEPTKIGNDDDLMPASYHALINARVSDLSLAEEQYLFAAAPQGEEIDRELLELVLGNPIQNEIEERLCQMGILQRKANRGKLRFKHGLIGDAIYKLIPHDRRKELHEKYFEALQDSYDSQTDARIVEQLAVHSRESGQLNYAIEYAERAGRAAMEISSLDRAKRHFEDAISLLNSSRQSIEQKLKSLELTVLWAKPSVYSASLDHLLVLESAEKIATEIESDLALSTISFWLGYFMLVLGDYDRAAEHLRKSFGLAEKSKMERLVFEAQSVLGCALAAKSEYRSSDSLLETAITAWDVSKNSGEWVNVTSVYARAIYAVSKADRGDFEKSASLFVDAYKKLEGFEHEIESSVGCLAAAVSVWKFEWEEALGYAEQASHRAERVSAMYQIGISRALIGYARWQLDRDPNQIDLIRKAAFWLDSQGMGMYLSLPFGWLSDALADAGRFDEVRMTAKRALDRIDFDDFQGGCDAFRSLAKVSFFERNNDFEAAFHFIKRARDIAALRDSPHEDAKCDLLAAEFHARMGNVELATELADSASSVFNKLKLYRGVERVSNLKELL